MWGQIEGRTKIEIARDAVASMLQGWPRNQQLGLMAYGHRSKGSCTDIEVLKTPATVDVAAMQKMVNALQPKGMTPITASVRMAAEQLKFSERKATVILVSDGEETCHADPCAMGKELEALGVDFTAHVIGFDIKKGSKAQAQLQCLASSTGGRYIDAHDAGELKKALVDVAAAPAVAAAKPAPKAPTLHFNEGCTGYDQENYAGNKVQIGGPGAKQVREVPERWRKSIKSLSCQSSCNVLVFSEPGFNGDHVSFPYGVQFPRIPADFRQDFGSWEVGCTAEVEQ